MTFKEMQQLKAKSGKVIANVQNGLGVNLKNRPIVVLISNLNGFTYFLKARSQNSEETPWEKIIDTTNYQVIIPFSKGEQNQFLDCAKIYKMKKEEFDNLYEEPVLLYNYKLDITIDIYEYVYKLLQQSYNHNPKIALIKVKKNKNSKKMEFTTLYISESLFRFEIQDIATPENILDNITKQSLKPKDFKKRMLNLHNKNIDTLDEILEIEVEIYDFLIDLRVIQNKNNKQWKKKKN